MTSAKIRIFTRVAKHRVENGESLENILRSWSNRLTTAELDAIRENVL